MHHGGPSAAEPQPNWSISRKDAEGAKFGNSTKVTKITKVRSFVEISFRNFVIFVSFVSDM